RVWDSLKPRGDATFRTLFHLATERTPGWFERAQQAQKKHEALNDEIVTCCVADVEPEPIDWLWNGRLARGKLTLIAGDPGLGKSQIVLDLVSRLSMGACWPDLVFSTVTDINNPISINTNKAPIGNSIILSAEDAVADTLRPRLEAANADLKRVFVLDAVKTKKEGKRSFSLQEDLERLGKKLKEIGNVVVVV